MAGGRFPITRRPEWVRVASLTHRTSQKGRASAVGTCADLRRSGVGVSGCSSSFRRTCSGFMPTSDRQCQSGILPVWRDLGSSGRATAKGRHAGPSLPGTVGMHRGRIVGAEVPRDLEDMVVRRRDRQDSSGVWVTSGRASAERRLVRASRPVEARAAVGDRSCASERENLKRAGGCR